MGKGAMNDRNEKRSGPQPAEPAQRGTRTNSRKRARGDAATGGGRNRAASNGGTAPGGPASHAEWEHMLTLYVDRELTSTRQREFEAHLETCSFCRAELDARWELRERLRRTWRPDLAAHELADERAAILTAAEDVCAARGPGRVRCWLRRHVWGGSLSWENLVTAGALASALFLAGDVGRDLGQAHGGNRPGPGSWDIRTPTQLGRDGTAGRAEEPTELLDRGEPFIPTPRPR